MQSETAAPSVTSSSTGIAPHSWCSRFKPSALRSAAYTVAPWRRSAVHNAYPMPDAAPVTTAPAPSNVCRISTVKHFGLTLSKMRLHRLDSFR